MNTFLFIVISFIIGFFSDIILYILAVNKTPIDNSIKIIKSLQPYFNHYKLMSPFLAGITVVIGTFISYQLFRSFENESETSELSLWIYILILFLFGMLLDYIINLTGIFKPYLNKYYNRSGIIFSAIFGGIANLIVGIPAYFISR
jgi:hypothetical protein